MDDRDAEVRRVVLSNGLRVVAGTSPGSGVFSVTLSLEAGSRYDTDEGSGLSSLAAGLMLEGTESLTGQELALWTDSVGASLDVFAGYETCSVCITGLVDRLDECLQIVSDVARHPRLRDKELESARRKQLADIAEDEDDPFTVARHAFLDLVYGSHPRHRPTSGRRDTVPSLGVSDVRSFMDVFHVPGSAVLAGAGDFDPDAFVKSAAGVFSDWVGSKPRLPGPADPPANGGLRRFKRRDRRQTHVIVGGVGIRRLDPRYHAVCVMDVVLGDSAGFGSRLGRRLRESEGLAYVVESDTASSAGLDPGVLWVYTATSPSSAGRALAVLAEELETMRTNPPSVEEFDSAKAYLRGRRLVESESCEERASRLVRSERYGLGLDYDERYAAVLESVTREDVLEASATLLDPARLSTVVVGSTSLWPEA